MSGSPDTVNNEGTGVLPWLIFSLKGGKYAINSSYVSGIEVVPENLTMLPQAADTYKGMAEKRGSVYPILNLRRIFGKSTVEEEAAEFKRIIEQRKQEHTEWVEALEKCVLTGERFTLAAEPQKCPFCTWYRKFAKENQSIGIYIKKAEEDHRTLHETSLKVSETAKKGDREKADMLLKMIKEKSVPQILKSLDEAEGAFRGAFKETVIVLSDGSQMLGLLVDEVLAVDMVSAIDGSEDMKRLSHSDLFRVVATSLKVPGKILVVNEDKLMSYSDVSGLE